MEINPIGALHNIINSPFKPRKDEVEMSGGGREVKIPMNKEYMSLLLDVEKYDAESRGCRFILIRRRRSGWGG